MEGFCDWKGAEFCVRLRAFVKENMDWMLATIEKKKNECPVMHNVRMFVSGFLAY